MRIEKTEFPGVLLIHNAVRCDGRGGMETVLDDRSLWEAGVDFRVREQRAYRIPKRRTFFGIHYQADGYPQDRIVQVLAGRGIDYIIDLNAGSPTFRKWISVELDGEDGKAVYIPHGYGHAFFSIQDDTWQLFTVNEHFREGCSKKINYKDPSIGLELPCEADWISEADRNAPML